jgi:small subunit ribosomal protein S7
MWDGKKSTSKRIFYGAMDIIDKKVEDKEPLEVFEEAINNIKPRVEVRSKRVGGANYQVPIQVNPKRQQSLAIRWVLQSIRSKSGKPMKEFLAVEIIDAYNKTGASVSMRENVHRMAEANKAFAHFAW